MSVVKKLIKYIDILIYIILGILLVAIGYNYVQSHHLWKYLVFLYDPIFAVGIILLVNKLAAIRKFLGRHRLFISLMLMVILAPVHIWLIFQDILSDYIFLICYLLMLLCLIETIARFIDEKNDKVETSTKRIIIVYTVSLIVFLAIYYPFSIDFVCALCLQQV